jgi:hypothetical protein
MSFAADPLGSGDIPYRLRVGNLYNAVTLTSANGTTPVTIITGAPGYYITDMGVQVDPLSTIGVASTISFGFTDSSSGAVFMLLWFLPTTAPTKTAAENDRVVTGPGNLIWSSKVANSVLSVALPVALVTGSVRFFVRYGLTSRLG